VYVRVPHIVNIERFVFELAGTKQSEAIFRSLTFAFVYELPKTPYFERQSWIAFFFAPPTQTQSTL
jgi:hypothetical protein